VISILRFGKGFFSLLGVFIIQIRWGFDNDADRFTHTQHVHDNVTYLKP